MQRRTRLALSLWLVLLSGLQGSAEPRATNGYVGTYVWQMRGDAFGGFSAIEILGDGGRFVALSDKSAFVTGRVLRDSSGRITALKAGAILPLLDPISGSPMVGRRADSEGLAILPGGGAFVSFENRARVARLDLKTGIVRNLSRHPDFIDLPSNGALEALAVGAGPTLYALPEETSGASFPVYRLADGAWDTSLSIPRNGRFLPVAADIGPDGRFYLLERDFRGIAGFASRLRRFDLTETGLQAEVTLLQTPFSLHDNLEGLSIWRDAGGTLHATMISDDNFVFVLRTELVEYRLPD